MIAVTGATGKLGRLVMEGLLNRLPPAEPAVMHLSLATNLDP